LTKAEQNENPGGLKPGNQFGPQSKNLASIVRGFISAVTMNARKAQVEFQWQARFHDSIIRDYQSFLFVSDYIRNNPANWKKKK
jgi:putative transposase